MRTALATLALVLLPSAAVAEPPASSHPGYVDGAAFRALIDEDREMIEVNLEGPMLQAVADSKDDDGDETPARELYAGLKAIHAVIGSVKGPASAARTLVQQTDRKLLAAGWRRVTLIKDESSWVSVLTHVSGDRVDGLVALIFDTEDKELVFANLAGAIDLNKLGRLGDELNLPGLDQVPGAR